MVAMEYHKKLRAEARRATRAVKDPTLREIAYQSILRHLYAIPHKWKDKRKKSALRRDLQT